MSPTSKEDRARAIEAAAYDVLQEKGFKGASMLAVARAAKASNETLYNWYGDKVGLFSALIRANTARVGDALAITRAGGGRGLAALEEVGAALYEMVTSDRAIALNRAAAADMTGALGAAIATGGRETALPMIFDLIAEAQEAGDLPKADPEPQTELFLALLIGDVQIRRAIGVLPEPAKKEATARAQRAVALLRKRV